MSFTLLGKLTAKPQCSFHRRAFSTIFSSPVRRKGDLKALERTKITLLHVLGLAAGREYGFSNRSDGFVSVKRLVCLLTLASTPKLIFSSSLVKPSRIPISGHGSTSKYCGKWPKAPFCSWVWPEKRGWYVVDKGEAMGCMWNLP